jgi:putative transposase
MKGCSKARPAQNMGQPFASRRSLGGYRSLHTHRGSRQSDSLFSHRSHYLPIHCLRPPHYIGRLRLGHWYQKGGLAQPYSNTARDAPPVALSRVGCCELSLACSTVTAKLPRSCYIVPMPTNLHRYYGAGYSHFITTSCYQRRPLLGTRRSRDLFLEVMEQIRQRHQFVVVGYVVMPEHVHLLFTEPERGNPSLALAALKQNFARRLLREIRANSGTRSTSLWNAPVAVGHVWQPRFYDFVVFTEKKRCGKAALHAPQSGPARFSSKT